MNMKKITLVSLLLLSICVFSQSDISPAGGDAASSSGSFSYSVGQVAYGFEKNLNFSIQEGVQQIYNSHFFCLGAKISALVPSGTNIKWYSSATGGTALATTTALLTGTYFYTQTLNNVVSQRIPVAVLVNLLPKTAIITAKSSTNNLLSPLLTTCQGSSVNLSLAAGSVGNIQWQSSTDGITYTNVGDVRAQSALSATNLEISFNTGDLTQTTWFRVVASNGICSSVTSAAIKITVSIPTAVGELSSVLSTVCTGSGTTLNLTNATGTIAWQKATVVNGVTGTFAAVAGNVTTTLTTGNLTATTAYKVVVSSGACSTSPSNVVTVTVSPKSTVKTISGAGAICNGSSKELTLATGSIGTIQWQSSTTSATATDFEDINGATNPVSLTVSPTVTTWYRAVATSGACSSIASAAVAVTVSQPTAVGELTSVLPTVCTGSGTTLSLTNATGTIAWQKATVTNGVTGTFAAITGNVTTTLTTGNLTATTAYKVVVSSGVCPTSPSNVVTVTVSPLAVAKTISGNTGATTQATAVTICSTSTKLLTYNTTGSVGTIKWQYCVSTLAPATTAVWTAITDANASTYNAPSVGQTGNVWFRVKVSSSPCSDAFSPAVNVWLKACPTSVRTVEKPAVAFGVAVYPNPSSENFNFTLTSSSEEKVEVSVYDMIGKLINKIEVNPSNASELQIGDNYPAGVYNVIVTQDANIKTLRVIKQ